MSEIYNPYDEEDLKNIRYSNEDPLVQYYIVRKSLDMSPGKIAAQGSHAAYMFAKYHNEQKIRYSSFGPHGGEEYNRFKTVNKWEESSFTKIFKKATDSKFNKIKEDFDCFCVRDAGKTEVPTGSETVLVLFPILKSKTPEIIWKLRNL